MRVQGTEWQDTRLAIEASTETGKPGKAIACAGTAQAGKGQRRDTCAFSKHYPPENYVIGALSDNLELMAGWGLRWLSAVRTRLGRRLDLLLEFIVLRHQLAVLQRTGARRPCFRPSERLFWVCAWLAQLTPIAYIGCQARCRRRQRETQRACLLRRDCLVPDATPSDSSGWRVGQLTPIACAGYHAHWRPYQ